MLVNIGTRIHKGNESCTLYLPDGIISFEAPRVSMVGEKYDICFAIIPTELHQYLTIVFSCNCDSIALAL